MRFDMCGQSLTPWAVGKIVAQLERDGCIEVVNVRKDEGGVMAMLFESIADFVEKK